MGALVSFMGAEQGSQVSNTNTPLEFIQHPYTEDALNYYKQERKKTLESNPKLKKNTEKYEYETYSDKVLQDTLDKRIEKLNSNTSGVTDEEKNKQLHNLQIYNPILNNMKNDITILDNILKELYDLDCITKAETKQFREVLTSFYEMIKYNILIITRPQMIILLNDYEVKYEINYRTLSRNIMKTCPTLENLISKRFNQPHINLFNIIKPKNRPKPKIRSSVPATAPAAASAPAAAAPTAAPTAAAAAGGNKTNKYKSKYKGKGKSKTKGKGKTKHNKRI